MMRQPFFTKPGQDQIWPGLRQGMCYELELLLLYSYPYAVSMAEKYPAALHATDALRHMFDQHPGVNELILSGTALGLCKHSSVPIQHLALLLLPFTRISLDYATTSPIAGSSFVEGAKRTCYDNWGEKMNQGTSDDELELRQLLADNLEAGFVQFVERFQGLAYRITRSKLNDEQRAYDAAQDAFINAYAFLKHQSREQILEMKLEHWFSVVIVHVCYRYIPGDVGRRRKDTPPRSAFLPLEDILNAVYSHTQDQPEIVVELHELILEAFLSLPSLYRIPCTLYYLDCLKAEEIAKLLNQPVGTIKSQISRGTNLLRKKLEMQMKEED